MSKRNTLLTTAAAAALVGAMATSASAFEVVDWNWVANVAVDIDIDKAVVDLNDLTNVEKMQLHFGNIAASASVSGSNITVDANPPDTLAPENLAIAVSNNQNITTKTSTFLHDLQIGAGAINGQEISGEDLLTIATLITEIDDELEDINEHTDIAALVLLGAAAGIVDPATISATASLSTVNTAVGVDNSATAVTNNASWTIETDGTEDILIADLTQLGIAAVSASAALSGVTVSGGTLSNVATAVGNNLNVEVGPIP